MTQEPEAGDVRSHIKIIGKAYLALIVDTLFLVMALLLSWLFDYFVNRVFGSDSFQIGVFKTIVKYAMLFAGASFLVLDVARILFRTRGRISSLQEDSRRNRKDAE